MVPTALCGTPPSVRPCQPNPQMHPDRTYPLESLLGFQSSWTTSLETATASEPGSSVERLCRPSITL